MTYTHLKFPLEPVPQITATHDQEHARTEVLMSSTTGADGKPIEDKKVRVLLAIQDFNGANPPVDPTIAICSFQSEGANLRTRRSGCIPTR